VEYCAFAGGRLGLSKAKFFAVVPREFVERRKQWLDDRRDMLVLAATVRRDIINFSMCHPKRPVALEDLLPSEPGTGARRPKRRRRAAIAENIRSAMSHFLPKEE
jgi:hypothetical protein